jgi:FixJ family two-component response regulator
MLGAAGLEVSTFSSARSFFAAPESQNFSCVVSDLRMPEVDGLGLQTMLGERMPHVRIIFLTGHADVQSSVRAMKSGAVDFLEKPIKRAELEEAIVRATQLTRRAKSDAANLYSLKRRYTELTPRERQVFALVTAGLLNKQVAAELGASEKTIKQHRGVVMTKMNATSLADLVVMADRLGIRPSNVDFSKAKGLFRA